MERLAGTILLQMVEAWADEGNRTEIREFMGTQEFQTWASVLDLDPQAIRAKLEAGNYQRLSFRTSYR